MTLRFRLDESNGVPLLKLLEAPAEIADRALVKMREFCADDDLDRLFVFDTPSLRYLVFTTVGVPLSPYLTPDLVRSLDTTIRLSLPPRHWPRPYDTIRVTPDIVRGFRTAPIMNTSTVFFASRDDGVEQRAIKGAPADELGRVMRAMLQRQPSSIVHVQVHPLKPIARF